MSDAVELGIPSLRSGKKLTIPKSPSEDQMEIERKSSVRMTKPNSGLDEASRLKKVAEDFEAIFLFQVLKQMRNTIHKEEMFHGGVGEDTFTEMMDEELAKKIASRSITGISEMLFRQLSRQHGISSGEMGDLPLPDMSETAEKLQQLIMGGKVQGGSQYMGMSVSEF